MSVLQSSHVAIIGGIEISLPLFSGKRNLSAPGTNCWSSWENTTVAKFWLLVQKLWTSIKQRDQVCRLRQHIAQIASGRNLLRLLQ